MALPKPVIGEDKMTFMNRCMIAVEGDYPDDTRRHQACDMQWTTAGMMTLTGEPAAADGTLPGETSLPTWTANSADTEVEQRKARPWGQFRGEVRALEDNSGAPVIEGYAAVFNKTSQPLEWGYRERIMPGAFTKTIKEADVRALFNHDPNYVLGRSRSGTLQLREDETGLHYRVNPPDEPWVRSLIASIKRGDIDQSSFAFQPMQEDWSKNDKTPIRNIREVRLFDVSPVTFPAYVDTIVQARTASLGDVLRSLEAPAPTTSHADDEAQQAGDPPPVRDLRVMIQEWRLAAMGISLDGTPKEYDDDAKG